MESINYLCNHTAVSTHYQHIHCLDCLMYECRMLGRTPRVNTSGLSSDGLEALRGGAEPPGPGGGLVTFVSWLTFSVFIFFVSGLLASRRKKHLCWMQELNLTNKTNTNNQNNAYQTYINKTCKVYMPHTGADEPAGGARGTFGFNESMSLLAIFSS